MGRKGKSTEAGDAVDQATDTVAAGAIEGAGAALAAGGDARDVAAATIGGAAAATAEALAGAGDENGDSVDIGEKAGKNGGTEAGAAEGDDDHITAFEKRCERLVEIAEAAEFESGTVIGDVRDALLDVNKAQPKGWGGMSELERKDFARVLEKVAKIILRKLVIIIAEEDEISVHAQLAGYRVNGDAFEVKVKAKGDEEVALQLFRLDGHEVVIISADSTRFHGQRREAEIPSDRPQLPFSDPASDAAPGEIRSAIPVGDEDLAGESSCEARDMGETVTIRITPPPFKVGEVEVTWEPGEIVGLAHERTYYVGVLDPELKGGAAAFFATTDPAALSEEGRVFICKVVTPAKGANAGAGIAALVALSADHPGATIRVNLKTGMVEKLGPQDPEADDQEDAVWEDIREATPEELAAERNSLADFDEAARDAGEKEDDEA